jgi:hypothetical protein
MSEFTIGESATGESPSVAMASPRRRVPEHREYATSEFMIGESAFERVRVDGG